MAERIAVRALINILEELPRDILEQLIRQQTDLEVVEFEPDGTDANVWKQLKKECQRPGYGTRERVVLISSFEEGEEEIFRSTHGERITQNFQEVAVIGISTNMKKVVQVFCEVRCDEMGTSLDDVINAIRFPPSREQAVQACQG